MGSLNNLYISQSYQGLLTFSTNSGSTSTLTEISDGTGQGLGLYLNNSGSASLNADMYIGGDLTVSGAFDIEGAVVIRDNVFVTGSIYSSADISSSRMLTGEITASNMTIAGTLNVYKLNTTIESSSVIFSSGSNILGDSTSDTQILNGTIIMSGSSSLTGSSGITGNLNVLGNISSSTLSGVGNVTTYSASVNTRLVYLEQPFSTSVDARLDALEAATASLGYVTTGSFYAYTASVSSSLGSIYQTTASLNTFSQSIQTSFNSYTQSNNTALNSLSTSVATRFTYTPTTGSNTFIGDQSIVGNQNITGSLTISSSVTNDFNVIGNSLFSGSVRGVVIPLTITSLTASMDCSLGNFFTLTLASGSNTTLNATNIQPGETISLRVTQPSNAGTTTGTLTWVSSIKFPQAFPYIATPITGAVDILSFQSYDTSSLYGVGVNTMV